MTTTDAIDASYGQSYEVCQGEAYLIHISISFGHVCQRGRLNPPASLE